MWFETGCDTGGIHPRRTTPVRWQLAASRPEAGARRRDAPTSLQRRHLDRQRIRRSALRHDARCLGLLRAGTVDGRLAHLDPAGRVSPVSRDRMSEHDLEERLQSA